MRPASLVAELGSLDGSRTRFQMKVNLSAILVAALALCSGCGTIAGHDVFATGSCMSPVQATNMKGVYRGIRLDAGALCTSPPPDQTWRYVFIPVLLFIEMPASLVADTLVLPYDLVTLTTQEKDHKE